MTSPREILSPKQRGFLNQLSEYLRKASFQTIQTAKSGHLGACSSSAELLATLYFTGVLKFDPQNPNHPHRDLVLLRGHLGPLRYEIFSLLGWVKPEELATYRQFGSRMKGHESMKALPGVDITPSGSLGMILSYAVGAGIDARENDSERIVYTFLGDGEEQEGNVSEAARHAASLRLGNLVCIMDQNGKQLSRPTADSDGTTDIVKTWQGYGWHVIVTDGHDVEQVYESLTQERPVDQPTLIVAKTIKGKGLEGCEDHFSGYHTISTIMPEVLSEAIDGYRGRTRDEILLMLKEVFFPDSSPLGLAEKPSQKPFDLNVEVVSGDDTNLDRSQFRYFKGLQKKLEEMETPPAFYLLTADFLRKDMLEAVGFEDFLRFVDVGIREQHLISMAHGLSTVDPNARIIVNYGDAFIYRCADQLNAAAQGGSRMLILSEYAGLSQGQNGETHQSVGQPLCVSGIPGIRVFEPGDVQDLYTILNNSLSSPDGLVYVRIHRENLSPLPRCAESDLGWRSYVVREVEVPDAVLVSSGLMIGNTLEAARKMSEEMGIECRVVNVVDHDSVDASFAEAFLEEGKPVYTVYNGHPDVLGRRVAQAVMSPESPVKPSWIQNQGYLVGDTGTAQDLIHQFQLDPEGIVSQFLQFYS